MLLWIEWWSVVWELRSSCSRKRNFLWLAVCLAGMTIRTDLFGVTSIIRILGLKGICYDRILDFYHSPGLKLDKLTTIWIKIILRIFPDIMKINGRILLVGDGLKIPKEGRKMPAVKSIHQDSDSNSKAEFIMGHSCQVVSILVGALGSVFAVPISGRIHEGVVFSNRDQRTLLDKMLLLLDSTGISEPFYFIADAYYASRKIISGLVEDGNHLITRVRSNAVAYEPAGTPKKKKGRGRPKKYGKKIKLRTLLEDPETMQIAKSPVYREKDTEIQYRAIDLYWRSVGILVRFVAVIHPTRGSCILMGTDLTLSPVEIIHMYGLRFKIELAFKQALHVLGTFSYHFWMRGMKKIKRRSGNQYLHRDTPQYRNAVIRKLDAYHRYIQVGLIAQGLLQYLSSAFADKVWAHFGSWIRTIRPGIPPSELVTAIALRNSLPEFLVDSGEGSIIKKFLLERLDLSRSEGLRLAG